MTTGAPRRAVTAFKGSTELWPGNWAMISAIRPMLAPVIAVRGAIFRWSDDPTVKRAKCGAAIPIKVIGPQNAVDTPAQIAVLDKVKIRSLVIFTPTDVA